MKRISFIGLETALTHCMQSVNNSQNVAWMVGLVRRCGAEQLGLSKIRALQSEERGLPKCCDPSTAKTATSTVSSRCWLRCHCKCKPRVSAILQESETRRASRWEAQLLWLTEPSEADLWWSPSLEWHLTALCRCCVLGHQEDSCNRICFKLVSTGLVSLRAC